MATDTALSTSGNIDERGVVRRLTLSVVGFGLTLAALVLMNGLSAPLWAFGVLLLPFFLAYELAYQGLFRT